MTAPEVMNSSPTVDAALAPAQPVRNQNLQMIVEQALEQLRQLKLQRQEIAQTIAITKRTVNGLAFLYGDELRRPEDDATAERRYGITNACRVVLNRSDTSLSGPEVYAILQREFPDPFRHQEIITPRSSLSSIDW